MANSILDDTKKVLGLESTYTVFDTDLIIYINAVFSDLNQLGLGPFDGFAIEDSDAEWDDYIDGDLNLNGIKTYLYLRVRTLFDPPTTSYLINAINEQIQKLEWRLNVKREGESWTDPTLDPNAEPV